jgi:Protein of unknown function (DUF2752)
MKTPQAHWPWRSGAVAVAALAVSGAVALLFFFDPATAGFFPVCTLHELTGWQCPGCGGLRAMHQLSHGHLAAAWRLNPLLVALLPVAFWLGLREAVRVMTGREWPGLVTRPLFVWLLAVALVLFGILRNLPWPGAS